jgi:hypothetical protein
MRLCWLIRFRLPIVAFVFLECITVCSFLSYNKAPDHRIVPYFLDGSIPSAFRYTGSLVTTHLETLRSVAIRQGDH